MATIHTQSAREELDRIKDDLKVQSANGKINPESEMIINSLLMLLQLFFSIFLEKTTKKTDRNSGKPPSQTPPDNTSKGKRGRKGKGKPESANLAANSRKVVSQVSLPVTQCGCCGESLEAIDVTGVERRTRIDILFEKRIEHFDAEIKDCPTCKTINKGQFPSDIYGNAIWQWLKSLCYLFTRLTNGIG